MKNNASKKDSLGTGKGKNIFFIISIVLGDILLVYFILMAIFNPSVVVRFFKSFVTESGSITCTLNDQEYVISTDSNYDVECNSNNCSKGMIKDLKENYVIYLDYEKNLDNMVKYFEQNGGSCGQ